MSALIGLSMLLSLMAPNMALAQSPGFKAPETNIQGVWEGAVDVFVVIPPSTEFVTIPNDSPRPDRGVKFNPAREFLLQSTVRLTVTVHDGSFFSAFVALLGEPRTRDANGVILTTVLEGVQSGATTDILIDIPVVEGSEPPQGAFVVGTVLGRKIQSTERAASLISASFLRGKILGDTQMRVEIESESTLCIAGETRCSGADFTALGVLTRQP